MSASPGDTYTLAFATEAAAIGDVSQTTEGGDIDDRFLVPPNDPATATAIEALAAGSRDLSLTDAEQVRRLVVDFADGFMVEERAEPRSQSPTGADRLLVSLENRRGPMTDAVTAFALAARALGVPSRVAIGFTPGEAVASGADGRTRRQIRGGDAATWPEVHLDGIGWVVVELSRG